MDFDAIFIPDSPKAIGQAAPMLAYQGVSKVRLLGTNVWNTSELVRRGQKSVENAIFVDSNFVNDPGFKTSKFFKDYVKVFGEEPGLFEAQGYEVGVLLRQTISGGERTRVGLAQSLTQLRQFQGVSGPMSMNSQHELMRPLTPFIVKSNEIVAWNPGIESSAKGEGDEVSKPKAAGNQKKRITK
jgi:branched-chain amino acid transport system substrate-binding protein